MNCSLDIRGCLFHYHLRDAYRTEWDSPDPAQVENSIELLCEFQPRIVVIDLGLRDLNGYEVAAEIRHMSQFTNTLPVALTDCEKDRDR